jgi:hypothetical protein
VRALRRPSVEPTPLQLVLIAQSELNEAVHVHLSLRERREFWTISGGWLARETARDADWETQEEAS